MRQISVIHFSATFINDMWYSNIQCFAQVHLSLNYSIIAIHICQIYLLHRERLLDVSLGFHVVLITILLLSWDHGDIVSRLDRRMAKFLFTLINHDNLVPNMTKFKLGCPDQVLTENYKYLLFKYEFFLKIYIQIYMILCIRSLLCRPML